MSVATLNDRKHVIVQRTTGWPFMYQRPFASCGFALDAVRVTLIMRTLTSEYPQKRTVLSVFLLLSCRPGAPDFLGIILLGCVGLLRRELTSGKARCFPQNTENPSR